MTKGVHRFPANSRRGRQTTKAKGAVLATDIIFSALTPTQRAWNEEQERKRKQKKEGA